MIKRLMKGDEKILFRGDWLDFGLKCVFGFII